MTLFARNVVVFLTCWVTTGQITGYSYEVSDFLTLFNGIFDDSAQARPRGVSYDLVQVTLVPVVWPALGGKPAIFFEDMLKGQVYRLQLNVISKESGDTICMTPFNYTYQSKYKPGMYMLSDLSSIKLEDLHTDESCLIAFVKLPKGVYFGSWPECRHFNSGRHGLYSVSFTCDGLYVEPPQEAQERKALIPYKFQGTGNRFPVPGTLTSYASPCSEGT